MAPPDERAVKAVIRAHRPKFRSKGAKLAFAVHAFFLAEGYKPVAVGKRADEAAPEDKLTQEVDLDGWDELEDVFAFRYLPEDGSPEQGLQVKMQAVGDTLLVHWQPVASADAPSTLELRVPDYVSETPSLDDVDGYKNLQQLLNQLDKALHVAPATKQAAAAAAAGDTLKVAAGRQGPTGGLDEPLERPTRPAPDEARPSGVDGDELHADGRLPLPLPDAEPDDDFPDPEGMVPLPLGGLPVGVAGPPPTAPGAADLVPPGLRAPGTSGGFGIPHIQPGPGLGPFGGGSGMLVGPGDPMFADRMRVPPGGGRGALPGARFDPIGPRGMPGWNPDDFRRGGPGNPQGPPHPDIQPPGPGRGTDFDSMFG